MPKSRKYGRLIPQNTHTYIFYKKTIRTMLFDKKNLYSLKKALLKLNDLSTEEGVTLIWDGDGELEAGNEVFVDGEEGLEPAKDGQYTYNGKTIMVEGGIVTDITLKPVEQPAEEETTENTEVKEEVREETSEEKEEEETETTTETETEETTEETEEPEGPTVEELQAIIEEQKAMIESLKAENEELKAKLEEPAGEPAEEAFKKQAPTEKKSSIDFSKYIRK